MTDADKLEGIANYLDVQGAPALALSLRQIAGRCREIADAVQRIDAMLEPDMDEPEGRRNGRI